MTSLCDVLNAMEQINDAIGIEARQTVYAMLRQYF